MSEFETTATLTVEDVDLETGELVGSAQTGGFSPAEVRVPLERVLGWRDARRERLAEEVA